MSDSKVKENFGVAGGAYFVSRRELMEWVNGLLNMKYEKVEQLCSGGAYCLVLDHLYPGKVPLNQVVLNAKNQMEYLNNFTVLEKAFQKAGIQRRIESEKLVKGKYMDNLEFLQWFKAYWEECCPSDTYDAEARKQLCKGYRKSSAQPSPKGKTRLSNSQQSRVRSSSSSQPKVVATTPKVKRKENRPKGVEVEVGNSVPEKQEDLLQQVDQWIGVGEQIKQQIKQKNHLMSQQQRKLMKIMEVCHQHQEDELSQQIMMILLAGEP